MNSCLQFTRSHEVWITNLETYSGAVSIFDALGGGPLTPTASNPICSDRNSFGGSANIVSSGFGLYGDSNQVTCKIPVGSYELDGIARAVARQAMANSSFTDAVNAHLGGYQYPDGTRTTMLLADPDDRSQCCL